MTGRKASVVDGGPTATARWTAHTKQRNRVDCMPNQGGEIGGLFLEFRRKVQETEVLSAAIERLLLDLRFTGRLSVVVQNGRVLKSGYEEGYFRRRQDARMLP